MERFYQLQDTSFHFLKAASAVPLAGEFWGPGSVGKGQSLKAPDILRHATIPVVDDTETSDVGMQLQDDRPLMRKLPTYLTVDP